jgi:hypothetical protein
MTKPGQDVQTSSLRARRAAAHLREELLWFARGPRKLAKQMRKELLELIFCESVQENRGWPGSVELAEQLGVTPRTVRTYLKERRERLCGPDKVWSHLYDEDGKPIGEPKLLSLDECAQRTGLTVRELRRQIWEQRRDRIAKVREKYPPKANQPSPSSDKS